RDRHRVRGPRRRPQYDQVRGEATLHRIVLAEATEPVGPATTRHRCGRGVRVRSVARDLDEPELHDVARHRRLCRVEACALQRTHEILLRRELLLRYKTDQRLLTVVLASELLHAAAASNTVPTRSPARRRSTASPARAATMAARQPEPAATRHASTFGSMPPSIVPSSTSAFARSRSSSATTFPSFARTPGTSVTKTSSRAPRLAAIAPAALSPFTLRISGAPSPAGSSNAAGAMTGTRPA